MLRAHVAPTFQLSSYSRVLKRTGSRARIRGFGPWLDHCVTLRKRTLPAKCASFLPGNMQIILVSSSQGSCGSQLAHIKDLLNDIQSTSYFEPPRSNTRRDEALRPSHTRVGMRWQGLAYSGSLVAIMKWWTQSKADTLPLQSRSSYHMESWTQMLPKSASPAWLH